jgi:hypothetical protein
MSDHPRLKRNDPARSAPIRDWSNMFHSPAAQSLSPPSADPAAVGLRINEAMRNGAANGAANGSATVSTPAAPAAGLSEEARVGIETAYRVIDEHLQEGRRAAQEQGGGGAGRGGFATAFSRRSHSKDFSTCLAPHPSRRIIVPSTRLTPISKQSAPLWANPEITDTTAPPPCGRRENDPDNATKPR